MKMNDDYSKNRKMKDLKNGVLKWYKKISVKVLTNKTDSCQQKKLLCC